MTAIPETVISARAGITEMVSSRQKQANVNQFAALIRDTGLSQADLARNIDVHVNTVSKWATGEVKTPGPVRAYLRLYSGLMRALADR